MKEVQFTTGNPLNDADWSNTELVPPGQQVVKEGVSPGLNLFRYREVRDDELGPWSSPLTIHVT